MDTDQREAFNMQFEADMSEALQREGKDPSGFRIENGKLEIEGAPDLPKPQ
jgi:Fe2+ or Zn2+ uptake regulation protein